MNFDVSAAFREIAKGDSSALKFVADFWVWVHTQDDLFDKDQQVPVERHVRDNFSLITLLASNEFFQQHKATLLPVIQCSSLAYISSENLKNSTHVLERITAQVLKSEYMNVFFTVAAITGGFEHAIAMNAKYRVYDFDNEPVKE